MTRIVQIKQDNKEYIDKFKELFGQRLKQLRTAAGLTQKQLSSQIGISNKYIQHLEQGTALCSLEVLIIICQKLQIQLKDLFNFDLELKLESQSNIRSMSKIIDYLDYIERDLTSIRELLQ